VLLSCGDGRTEQEKRQLNHVDQVRSFPLFFAFFVFVFFQSQRSAPKSPVETMVSDRDTRTVLVATESARERARMILFCNWRRKERKEKKNFFFLFFLDDLFCSG
jgi:hypothetical protein